MEVLITLTTATICFLGSCYPALIGQSTPSGEFKLIKRYTQQAGYGGDILQFNEDATTVYAIHRPWLLKPDQHRLKRLNTNDAAKRTITSGCINVSEEVYEKLVDCCQGATLKITK